MYDDFVHRVYKQLHQEKRTPEIQRVCDYIHLHPEEKLNAGILAKLAGYTEYYFTRKFQTEIGCSLNEYINRARIERACFLLLSTEKRMQEISEASGFSSRHYFNRVFREEMHCTPSAYRMKKGKES